MMIKLPLPLSRGQGGGTAAHAVGNEGSLVSRAGNPALKIMLELAYYYEVEGGSEAIAGLSPEESS